MADIDKVKAEGVELAANVIDKYEDVYDASLDIADLGLDFTDDDVRTAFVNAAREEFGYWLERQLPFEDALPCCIAFVTSGGSDHVPDCLG